LRKYGEKFTPEQMLAYWREADPVSIDGLPTRLPAALPA
jgi:hypothetical protein